MNPTPIRKIFNVCLCSSTPKRKHFRHRCCHRTYKFEFTRILSSIRHFFRIFVLIWSSCFGLWGMSTLSGVICMEDDRSSRLGDRQRGFPYGWIETWKYLRPNRIQINHSARTRWKLWRRAKRYFCGFVALYATKCTQCTFLVHSRRFGTPATLQMIFLQMELFVFNDIFLFVRSQIIESDC